MCCVSAINDGRTTLPASAAAADTTQIQVTFYNSENNHYYYHNKVFETTNAPVHLLFGEEDYKSKPNRELRAVLFYYSVIIIIIISLAACMSALFTSGREGCVPLCCWCLCANDGSGSSALL